MVMPMRRTVSDMRTEEYLEERARRADPARVNGILARVGKGNPPVEGQGLLVRI